MRSRLTLALLAVLAGVAWLVLRDPGAERRAPGVELPAPTTAEEPGASFLPATPQPTAEPVDHEREVAPAAPFDAARTAVFPSARGNAGLRLRVVDPDGAVLEAARIEAFPVPGRAHDLLAFDDGRGGLRRAKTDARGEARLADAGLGPWWVIAERGGGLARRRIDHTGHDDVHELVLDVARMEGRLTVRVVDAHGVGIEGAEVTLAGGLLDGAIATGDRLGEHRVELFDRTGPGGTALFGDPGFTGLIGVARAPDGRSGTATLWTRDRVRGARAAGFVITVAGPGELRGAVQADGVELHPDTRVLARLMNNDQPHYTTSTGPEYATPVVGGRYRFEALPAGYYTLGLKDPAGARLRLEELRWGETPMENSVRPLTATVEPGGITTQDLAVEPGAAIAGRVRLPETQGGGPVEGARIRATLAPRNGNFPDGFYLHGTHVWRYDSTYRGFDDHPDSHFMTTTGADGRYRLDGLPAGTLRLEVAANGLAFESRQVEVTGGATVRLEHELDRAGAIQGVCNLASYLGVTRKGEDAPRMLAIMPRDGLFAFSGLEPGEWVLGAFHSNTSVTPVPLITVTVAAGRTTFVNVDTEAGLPVRMRGRVLTGLGEPIAGAHIRMSGGWQATDSEGRFEFSAVFPLGETLFFHVRAGALLFSFELRDLAAGAVEWTGDLMLGSESVSILTRDAQGLPSGASLSLWGGPAASDGLKSIGGEAVTIPADGELVLDHLPNGRYTAKATFPGGAEAEGAFEVPLAEPLVLTAPPTGRLEVLVRTHDGRPAANVIVTASTWLGAGPPPDDEEARRRGSLERRAETDAEGRALLDGVAAGPLRVHARKGGGFMAAQAPAPEPQELHLVQGELARVTFALPPE